MGEKFKLKHAGLVFAFMLLFSLIGFTAIGAVNVVRTYAGGEADGDDVVEDAPSFSSMSQAAASYLGKSMMPSSGTNGIVTQMPLDAGNGGGYIAFVGKDVEWGQWITSLLTTASAKVGYKTYQSVKYTADDRSNALYLYSIYGASLHAMGFDSTGTASSGKMTRAVGGWILYFLYTLSGFVPGMFKVAIKVLQTVNPFQVFSVDSMKNIISPTNAPAKGSITDTIGHALNWFYDGLYFYGWTICMPLFIALVLLELYLFKKTKASTAIKKLVLRMVAIGAGIPLLGATYTQILEMISSDLSAGNTASTRVVCSILLDFGSWAENRRLDWFSDDTLKAVVDNTTGKVDIQATSVYRQRRICLDINAMSNPIFGQLESDKSGAYGIRSALNVTSNLYNADDSGDYTAQVFNECQNLIKRYINGDTYTSADWETRVKSTIHSPDVVALMGKTDSIEDFEVPDSNEYFASTVGGVNNLWGSGRLGVSVSGDFTAESDKDESVNWGTSKSYVTFGNAGNNWNECVGYMLDGDSSGEGGLSHMALYNYLNTSFGSSSLTLYSTTDSTSLFTREQHYSVNLIGGGVAFGYWFNAVALLLSFIVLGFAYAGAMIFYIISRSIRMLLAIPGMLLGSIKAFGKVIVYTISMIMQVLATIILYNIATLMLESIDTIITTPLINSVTPSATLYVGSPVVSAVNILNVGYLFVLLLIGGVVQLIFVFFAIKERRTIVKGINEAAQQIIDKLLDTNATADNSPTAAQKLAGAGAAAAGGAAAAKFARGRQGKNNSGDKSDSVEDTKNAQKNDDAAGTGGGDETPDATGAGGESDKDGTGSGGIEGEEKALGSGGDAPGIEEKTGAAAGTATGAASGAVAGEEAAGKDDSDGTGSGSDDGSSGESASDAEIAAEAENAESLSEMSDTSEDSDDSESGDGSDDGSDSDGGDDSSSGEDGDPSGSYAGDDAGTEGSDGGSESGSDSSSDSGASAGAAGAAVGAAGGASKSGSGTGAAGSSGGASKSGAAGKGSAKGAAGGKASTAGAKKGASANSAKAGAVKGVKVSADGKSKDTAGSDGGSKSYNEAKAAAQKRIDTAKKQAAKNSAAAAKKNDAKNAAKNAKNANAGAKANGSAKSGNVKGAKPSNAGPSVARQAMANMAAAGVATAVATALGADAQTAAQAGQMAMMSASMASYSGGGNNNSAGDTSSTAVGGSAPSAVGGSAPSAVVSAVASAAMPRDAGSPVSGNFGGGSVQAAGSAAMPVSAGRSPGSFASGSGSAGAPAHVKSAPQIQPSSNGSSSGYGGLGETMSASEAAEIIRMNKEAQKLEHQNRVQMRSGTLAGRAFNAVEAAPGNAVRSVANTAVGAARGVKNGAVSVKNGVVNTAAQAVGGVKHVANGVQRYGKSVSASHTMKKQNKELSAFVKAEAKREKRIEKATRKK